MTARKLPPPKSPTVALARALRSLGLLQTGGPGVHEFSITGIYVRRERRNTIAVFYTRYAERIAADNADRIEQLTDAAGFPFHVSVRAYNGRPAVTITNSPIERHREPYAGEIPKR